MTRADGVRLRHVAMVNPSKSEVARLDPRMEVSFFPMEAIGFGDLIVGGETREIGDVYSGFSYFVDGDVLVAKITPSFENGKGTLAANLSNGIGFATTEVHVLRPWRIDGRYLNWLVQSNPFRGGGAVEMRGAAGQQRVPAEYVANFAIPVKEQSKQGSIADFLDRETARIDQHIAKKNGSSNCSRRSAQR